VSDAVSEKAIAQLFVEARTYHKWTARPVSDDLLRRAVEIACWGPTSTNCLPMRVVFLSSREAKERLRPALVLPNVAKTMSAPVTAIVAYDLDFDVHAARIFPHNPGVYAMYRNDAALKEATAFRNGSLQGAYLIFALRALGLDCGALSGFDNAKVDAEFFAGTGLRSNFLCNIGYGDKSSLLERHPRLTYEEITRTI
jgi:3-hydroxypropanoate dehydrogenase